MAKIAQFGLNIEELNLPHHYRETPVMGLKELDSNLKTLRCNSCHLSVSDLIAIVSSLPKLQELDLGLLNWGKDVIKELDFRSTLKCLLNISVNGDVFYVSNMVHPALTSNRVLLSGVASVSLRAISENYAAYALRYCSNLNSICVGGIGIDEPSSRMFIIENSISYERALCALQLRYLNIGDTTLCSIA